MKWEYGDHRDYPTCPHCGTEERELCDVLGPGVGDGSVNDMECESCGREFRFRVAVTWTFQSMEPVDDAPTMPFPLIPKEAIRVVVRDDHVEIGPKPPACVHESGGTDVPKRPYATHAPEGATTKEE